MPYCLGMHTVVETPAYLASAGRAGMTEAERIDAANTIAANPKAGALIVGSGGCRKLRIAREGQGKSGGYRVVTYYAGENRPVFLLAALSKGKAANFSDAQIKRLAEETKKLSP